MSKLQIPQHGLQYLAREICSNFKFDVIRDALELYRKNAVIFLQVDHSGSVLHAKVKEDGLFEIKLDTDVFGISTCSCGSFEYCAHMAAAFLLAYQLAGQQPDVFWQEYQQAQSAQQTINIEVAKKTAEARVEAERYAKHARAGVPKETTSAEEWHTYFESKFGKTLENGDTNLNAFYNRVMSTLSALSKDWNPTKQLLYTAHIYLFILKQIDADLQRSAKRNSYLYGLHPTHTINECIQKLTELTQTANWKKIWTDFPGYARAIGDFLAENGFPEKQTSVDWLYLYRFFWGAALHNGGRSDEIHRLNEALKAKKLSSHKHGLLQSALAHFEMMSAQDQQAIARLNAISLDKSPSELQLYLHTHLTHKRWDKLLLWIAFLAPHVRDASDYEFDKFFYYWSAGANHEPNNAAWRNLIVSLQPKSHSYYADYLLEHKKYREWIDLHLYNGYFPDRQEALRKLEDSHPELLLPLYHQTADAYIAMRNREGYQTAVILLKRLSNLYKKLKKENKWKRYIQQLALRHSRLRALQEELKKGKLIA